MPKVTLMILFNHNYEQNIDQLDQVYKGRFEHVWYIVPFYTGDRKDVITVYENSHYFEASIAKALEHVRGEGFDHYMLIADDLLLNPKIDQHNYQDFFSIDEKTAFIPGPFLLNDVSENRPYRPFAPYWFWLDAATDFTIRQRGIEVAPYLPSYEQALQKLSRHGFYFTGKVRWNMYLWKGFFGKHPGEKYPARLRLKKFGIALFFFIKSLLFSKKVLSYPMLGSYSDILIIPHRDSHEFMRYCGIFGALNLFAEIAVPTALAFSTAKMVDEAKLTRKACTFWTPEDILRFETKWDHSLTALLENFPENILYIHPVKIAKWTR